MRFRGQPVLLCELYKREKINDSLTLVSQGNILGTYTAGTDIKDLLDRGKLYPVFNYELLNGQIFIKRYSADDFPVSFDKRNINTLKGLNEVADWLNTINKGRYKINIPEKGRARVKKGR